MTGRSYVEAAIIVVGLSAAVGSGVWAWKAGGPYGEKFTFDPRVKRIYDAEGHLSSMAIDGSGDLVFDTWNYYDSTGRLVRIDFDDDQDGVIDRRRFFKPDGSVERTVSLRTGSVPAAGSTK